MMQKSKCFWLPCNYSLCYWLSKVQFITPKGLNGSSKNYFRSWKNHFGVSYYHLELDAFSKAYQVTKSKKRNVLRNQIHEKKKQVFIYFPPRTFFSKKEISLMDIRRRGRIRIFHVFIPAAWFQNFASSDLSRCITNGDLIIVKVFYSKQEFVLKVHPLLTDPVRIYETGGLSVRLGLL